MNHTSRPGRRWITILGVLTAVVLIVAGIMGYTGSFDRTDPGAATDMNGRPVHLDTGATPDPQASATPDGTGRFQVPAVGLNVPLGSLNAVGGTITPPGFTSAYLVRNRGVTPARASRGTVFVVTHSIHGGGTAPGNYLVDVTHQRSRLAPGVRILVDNVAYTVTGSRQITKTRLGSDPAIWTNTPGRLVIITCMLGQHGQLSPNNLIIQATQATT